MAELVIITGPPGSGKSTVSDLVVSSFEKAALVAGDRFFDLWVQGRIEPWLPEAREQNQVVLRGAAALVGEFVQGGCSVVYDGVIDQWFLQEFLGTANVLEVHYFVLLPELEECQQRVADRTGHGFNDPEATERMYRDFSQSAAAAEHIVRIDGESPQTIADELIHRIGSRTSLLKLPVPE